MRVNLCIISFLLLILSQLNSVLPKLCYHLQDFLQLLNTPGKSIFSVDGAHIPRVVCYHNTLLNVVLKLCCQGRGLSTPEVSLWQSQLAWIKSWGCWSVLTQSALLVEVRVTPFHPRMVGWAQQIWKGTSVCGHSPIIRAEWKSWAKFSTQAQPYPSFTAGRRCLVFSSFGCCSNLFCRISFLALRKPF